MKGLVVVYFPLSFFICSVFAYAKTSEKATEQVIDLRNQFRTKVESQIYPFDDFRPKDQLCHIYASTALAEAACFRRTGKHLDLSESFLLLGHYLELKAKDIEDSLPELGSFLLDSNPKIVPYKHPYLGSRVSVWKGGSSYANLNRVAKIGGCLESDLLGLNKVDELIQNQLRIFRWLLPLQPWYVKSSTDSSGLPYLIAKNALSEIKSQSQKILSSVQNSKDVQECFRLPFKVYQTPYSEDQAKELLKRQTPWICIATAEYDEVKSNLKRLLDSSSGHSVVMLGGDPSGWIVRDTISQKILTVPGKCRSMVWME